MTKSVTGPADRVGAKLIAILVLGAIVLTIAAALVATPSEAATGPRVSVIVRERGASDAPEDAVEDLGGSVGQHIELINAFVAELPEGGIPSLEALPEVHSVTVDAPVTLSAATVDGFEPKKHGGSWYSTAKAIGANDLWKDGILGQGVDVALIDSGVAPVEGLNAGNVLDGPDLSFESQSDEFRYLDTYGHGTHMAGLIAGRDGSVDVTDGKRVEKAAEENFVGMAPAARLVSVKVASSDGATDVSQVIGAIDWVVQHAHSDGLNIRVLNLSFGTDGVQSYLLDPLSFAAEVAWRKGIVVSVAAGNEGFGSPKLNNPAYDPYVLAVGAADMRDESKAKEALACEFSSSGNEGRTVDVFAPGRSIVSLRTPGSRLDEDHPGARVGESRFFRGSGTSQAAAIVSGAAALLVSQDPSLTPDQVKGVLMETAEKMKHGVGVSYKAGVIDLKKASKLISDAAKKGPLATYQQSYELSTGLGSLEAARGSVHVVEDGTPLTGENDILGPWDGRSWTTSMLEGRSWTSGDWNGRSWTGDGWAGRSWTGRSWTGRSWTGRSWTGRSWTGRSWTGRSWTGGSWDDPAVSGKWSGAAWSSSIWE